MKNTIIKCILSLAVSMTPTLVMGQQDNQEKPLGVIELRQIANQAYKDKDYQAFYAAIADLNKLRPYNAEYMAQYVLASSLLEDRSSAYNKMLVMQQQGLSYDFNKSSDSEFIRGTEVYDYVNDLMVRSGEPSGDAELLFELPLDVLLPTSVAWDPERKMFLVGTASNGGIYAVSREGEISELARAGEENGLWGIYGLEVDSDNNRLWVSSSANEAFEGFVETDAGRSALFEFELDSMKLVKRYPVPVDGRPHRLGDLTRSPTGDIYAVDTILPIIYKLGAGAERLQPFMASPELVSLRGIDMDDEGKRLYVADYELGIMVADLESSQASMLKHEANLNVGGIEGLFFTDGRLVIIQNSNKPQRIMRLDLDDTGKAVSDVAPLTAAQPFFDYPSFGAVVDDELYFLANSHWVRTQTEPVPIRFARTNLDGAANGSRPDLEKFWEDYNSSRGLESSEAPAAVEKD